MQRTAPICLAFLLGASVVLGADTNPLGKVIELLDNLAAKVTAEGVAEAKAYKEYFEWCDDVSKNTQFEIKTAKAKKEDLEAELGELAASIEGSTTKIEELSAAIASDESELKEATAVRDKEVADFQKAEAELVDTVDTLDRAVAILEREMAKNPAAFAQIDSTNTAMLAQALNSVIDAAAFTTIDKQKLTALVQSQQGSDDDDSEFGAPAAATYKTHSTNIVDVLVDMKDKAEEQLADLRKAEKSTAHNFAMLKQSLEDQVGADNHDLDQEKAAKSASEERQGAAEGDLSVTSKELTNAESELATASSNCMQTAADHEATVAARAEELKVIATATKIIKETVSGAVEQTYSLLQTRSRIQSRADLKNNEVVTKVKQLARTEHSAALAQLASRMDAVLRYGSANGDDVFAKIKGLISDMIAKLEKEADEDATEKAYCDEQMSKTEAKKADLDDTIARLTSKIDQASAQSAKCKEEVKELQQELAALSREQADMDSIRAEEHADYLKAKEELELGISGVQKALSVLRDYYGEQQHSCSSQQCRRSTSRPLVRGRASSVCSRLLKATSLRILPRKRLRRLMPSPSTTPPLRRTKSPRPPKTRMSSTRPRNSLALTSMSQIFRLTRRLQAPSMVRSWSTTAP